jgi:SPP1 gp7 family putative phage head morphogenesis protein
VPTRRDNAWEKAKRAEIQYAKNLKRVARHVGDIVQVFPGTGAETIANLRKALEGYANTLTPWAEATARRMVWDVSRRNEKAWVELSKTLGQGLRDQIYNTPLGAVMQGLITEQVGLIKSLPLEAAQRVQELAINSLQYSSRGEDIIKMIMDTGHVTKSRAVMIARTETGKAVEALTEARSVYVGSEGYIWTDMEDGNVRPSHKKMHGKFVRWDTKPEVEPGKFYHAGCFPNCRCICVPVIPDKFM